MSRTARGYTRKGKIRADAGTYRDALIADPETWTITRGHGRHAITKSLDGATVRLEGGGAAVNGAAVMMFGVAGLAANQSQLYLVVDGPDFQWRVQVLRTKKAHLFVENVTTLQRERASALTSPEA